LGFRVEEIKEVLGGKEIASQMFFEGCRSEGEVGDEE